MRFAFRLTTLGIVFVFMFSVIGLRLWFVQVAEGPTLALAAEELTWLSQSSPAPRGDIYDRNGNLLVTSRLVPAVVIDRTFIQPDQKVDLIRTLAAALGMDPVELDGLYNKAGINGRTDPIEVSPETAYVITESLDDLPGVEVVTVPERVYLTGPTLAHVIGHLGVPNPGDLAARPELDPGVRIGQLGVEKVYDRYLEGVPGLVEYRSRAGKIIDQRAPIDPQAGDTVVLTIDLDLQELVELALEQGVQLSNSDKEKKRAAGQKVFSVTKKAAAVVLDANTFEVMALASYPDFDPQLFATGIGEKAYKDLVDRGVFNDLATSGLYPPASTFKAITYTGKLEKGLPFDPNRDDVNVQNQTVHCDGTFTVTDPGDASPQVKHDWYFPRGDKGWLDIHGAFEQSCNIFFWNVGWGTWRAYKGTARENILQEWATGLGYGIPTGIDLGEQRGTVPTRELFEQLKEIQLETGRGLLEASRLELPGGPWLGGDLIDFAIGQGFFTATPLQVAVSYATLVNGGKVMEPRVVKQVLDGDGNVVFDPKSGVIRNVDISPSTRASLLADLNRVVTHGTASSSFKDFGEGLDRVGGKTGTSQASLGQDNHAWFVGVAPLDNPRYIVVVLIDEGGSGGAIAAPVARHIMQYLMGNVPTPIVKGDEAQ